MKPHKHAELIKAWANGTQIQFRHYITREWVDIDPCNALFSSSEEYRIKPEEKKPIVRWLWAWHNLQSWTLTDFYTEDEVAKQGYDVSRMICLGFTRTEFPE